VSGPKSETASFALPAGTVTFLLSDIEGSTRLWESHPDAMRVAVPEHYELLSAAVASHDGVRPVEQGEGDSVVAAFTRASDALAAALEAQRALLLRSWPDGIELRVRIALHTAEAQLRDEGNYFGVALSRCARIRAIARGGQTLLSRSVRDLVVDRLPEHVELVDCGEHRLRDLGRPEQVFALAHPDLPAIEPGELHPLESLPNNNLPGQLSSFVGREHELSELRATLAATRMLTLTGAGGSGKTRLALTLAAEALDRYPDGVWWVELAALADPALVGETTAAAIGVRPLPGMTSLQAVCRALTAGRALVVLDNCEHLLDACAEAAAALLESCPGVTVLATSRAPLGVPGESDWRVPALAMPKEPALEQVESVSQYDAVKLFVERAVKVRPNFAVTNENAPALAQICSELDGIPLAIELAAARVRMLSLEQIARGLADRFHLLTGGARTALPRQQTLRASVDWSHDLLSDHERTLLRRLGVFAGGFSLDAVEHVCADKLLDRYAILDLLSALVEKSLVRADEHGTEVRYRLLETVRQYGVERLAEAGERAAIRVRHLQYFVALADEAEAALVAAGSERWLTILDSESPNMAASFEHALAVDPPAALRIAVAQAIYWTLRGRMAEAEAAYAAALAAAPEPSAMRARALWARAWLLMHGGVIEQAVGLAQEAIAAAEQFGDPSTAARAFDVVGAIQMLSDPVGAATTLERGADLAREAGDDWALGVCLIDIALALLFQDREADAIAAFEAAYPVNARIEYGENLCYHWYGTSWFGYNTGDRTRLREGMRRCRDTAAELGEPVTWGSASAFLAIDDADHGLAEAALGELGECMAQMIAGGAGIALPAVIRSVAYIQGALGMLDAADGMLTGLEAQTAGQFAAFEQWTYSIWANVARLSGDLEKADIYASKALELATLATNDAYRATALLAKGRVAAARGKYAAAETEIHDAIALALPRGFRPLLADSLAALAVVAAGLKSQEEAARLLGASDRALEDLDGRTRWKDEQASLDKLRSTLATELGPEPYAEGRELSLENAIGWARRARGQRKRPAGGWESLTPTELKVVELACEGLTNAAIGERMFISGGTVKVHLGHVYAKLDVPNRAALATLAAGRNRRAAPAGG
jgi:predicted ATPase/class 3 adenylate cyclase/DNA-binding CsgD family transcriptional regulator